MRSVIVFGFLIVTGASAALASEAKRDLDAHEHGVGKLNIAFEKGRVAMELEAPGGDIVGFEHPAETAADRKKVDAAIAILARPLDIFTLPADARCQVREANVELHGGDGDGHDEHHNGKETGHTEFHAEFVLSCADPSAVTRIEFPYFSTFPNAKELEVQMISDKGSTAFEVKRDRPRLDLSGMI